MRVNDIVTNELEEGWKAWVRAHQGQDIEVLPVMR